MHRYLDHTADVGIEASGDTLEEAFSEAARAMFGLMVPAGVEAFGERVEVEARAGTIEELLVEFLNELLAQQGIRNLVFAGCEVREIRRAPDGGFSLRGDAWGADPRALEGKLGQEVKAASYYGLKVEECAGRFTVRCVLDM